MGSRFVALWTCAPALTEVGRGVCGPRPEAGTPGHAARPLSVTAQAACSSLPWLLRLPPSSLRLWTWVTGPGFLLLVKSAQVSWHTAVLPQLSRVARVLW